MKNRGSRPNTEEGHRRLQERTGRLSLLNETERTRQWPKTMNNRTLTIAAVAVVLSGVVLGFALVQRGGQQKIALRQKELEQGLGKVTEPMTSSIRNFNPIFAPNARPHSPPRGSVVVEEGRGDQPKAVVTCLTIFAADPQPGKPPHG